MLDAHIMIIGDGHLGSDVLDMLVRRVDSPRVTLVGRNAEKVRRRVNLSTLIGTQLGFKARIAHRTADVNDIARLAEVIAECRPDIVLSTVSLQAYWVISELPTAVFRELDEAEIGPWLPMQLTLIHKVMQAVRESGQTPLVLNAALPDATHAILSKVGLAPTVGVGNVANVVPGLRHAAADMLSVNVAEVEVRLAMEAYVSHRLPKYGDSGGAPYILRVVHEGTDVTERVDQADLLGRLSSKWARLGGLSGMQLTAASAISVLDAMTSDSGAVVHAPGPRGLIGGYPVQVDREGVNVLLPPGCTQAEAEAVNAEALKYDGIEEILADGSVRYSARHMEVLDRMLGYSHQVMTLADSEQLAAELAERYAEFRKKLQQRS